LPIFSRSFYVSRNECYTLSKKTYRKASAIRGALPDIGIVLFIIDTPDLPRIDHQGVVDE
jgi:hypothetical protein